MDKIPCIKCTPELWEYIKPYFKEWGYHTTSIGEVFDEEFCILTLNWNKDINCYGFGNYIIIERIGSELINNVEEFLEMAAELKGFTYKRKDIMEINGIEIKPGMVIEIEDDGKKTSYIVFPLLNEGLGVVSYNRTSWDDIKNFVKNYHSKIVCIHDLISYNHGALTDGEILWEKPKEVVITRQEIADKFNIQVEQLKII